MMVGATPRKLHSWACTTLSARPTATPASMALPPRRKMSSPAMAAAGWLATTTPLVPWISGRKLVSVVPGTGTMTSFISLRCEISFPPGIMPQQPRDVKRRLSPGRVSAFEHCMSLSSKILRVQECLEPAHPCGEPAWHSSPERISAPMCASLRPEKRPCLSLLSRHRCSYHLRRYLWFLLDIGEEIALHLSVVQLTCNANGDPDILLVARFHAQPGGAYHGSHDGILPQEALPCQRPNWQGQYRYPCAQGQPVHLPRVSHHLQRYHRHDVLSAAHLGRDRGQRRDRACPWMSRARDCGGFWVRRAHESGLVGPLGPSGPSRARVPGRTPTGLRTR